MPRAYGFESLHPHNETASEDAASFFNDYSTENLSVMSVVTIVKGVAAAIVLVLGIWFASRHMRIWEKDDTTVFEYVFDRLSAQSDYGFDLSGLNGHEKVFMSMALLAQEVNNGGFDQYFFNLGGRYNDILVSSAEAVKAFDIAKICERALAIYAEHAEQEGPIEELTECDDAFYSSADAICDLCAQYAREHKDSFKL